MKLMKLPKLQSGISMVEILIAMLIGAFLTGGLIQMFITTRSTNKLQDAVSKVQENGHFAMELITRDVRKADYFMECSTADKDITAITGTDNDSSVANVIDGTDTLTVRWTRGPCDNRVSTTTTYYIGTGTNGQNSLCRINSALPPPTATCGNNELIEGVQDMQILYGVDTDPTVITEDGQEVSGTPNYYVPATNVVTTSGSWDDVVAIRISLLAATMDDNISGQPVPYTYNGSTTTPTDHRVRRVYNSTITLRNRLN